MVSYLNVHDALEQRRRGAREASTSGRPGPRAIVSCMRATSLARSTFCVSCMLHTNPDVRLSYVGSSSAQGGSEYFPRAHMCVPAQHATRRLGLQG